MDSINSKVPALLWKLSSKSKMSGARVKLKKDNCFKIDSVGVQQPALLPQCLGYLPTAHTSAFAQHSLYG